MTAVDFDFVGDARALARRLEDTEASRSNVPVESARLIVARKLGIAPGTLTSLRKNRLKSIPAAVYARLTHAVERLLEKEIAALEHELAITRQKGLDADPDTMAAVATDLARVRAALALKTATAPADRGER